MQKKKADMGHVHIIFSPDRKVVKVKLTASGLKMAKEFVDDCPPGRGSGIPMLLMAYVGVNHE